MAKIIFYLLEVNVVLAAFYLLYVLVLRKETFFSLNRFFLLGILVFSFLFPLLSFDFQPGILEAVELPMERISNIRMSYYDALALWEYESFGSQQLAPDNVAAPKTDWLKLSVKAILLIYAVGVVVCLSRFFWTMKWLFKMIAIYPKEKFEEATVVKFPRPIAPFSFLSYVFVHDTPDSPPDFKQILAHELAHIRQKHSIDLIFVQLLAAFLWFNPLIWMLIKSLKTTHEYIADKTIINSGYSLVEYQAMLLRQLISNNSYGLVHNFNLSFIKKRITMMKNKKSGWQGKVKVALAMVSAILFGALIVQCNSSLEEQAPANTEKLSLDFTEGINVPVLHERRDPVVVNLDEAVYLNIAGDKLTFNGEPSQVDEIIPKLQKGNYSLSLVVVMKVDKDQKMGFIRKVQDELRKTEYRRLLYLGKTSTGEKVETPLLLPPHPGSPAEYNVISSDELNALNEAGKIELLKIEMGNNPGMSHQQNVYHFVKKQMERKSPDYVVSALFKDNDTFNDYLVSLVHLKDGFNQIYQERAQEMFGKSLFDINTEEFQAVREGVPMAISIAED